MKRELTLTDIAGYLPYGLKLLDRKRGMTTVWEWQSAACCDWNGEEKVEMISGEKYSEELVMASPILRPMSDLAREITHKGKTFIPIECIAEMTREDGKDSNWTYDLINWFGEYDPIWSTYELLMALPEWLIISVIDKLCEWMFDYRGLIDAGLAVSVHDLKQNPYEK
jgi:hypothetical protein